MMPDRNASMVWNARRRCVSRRCSVAALSLFVLFSASRGAHNRLLAQAVPEAPQPAVPAAQGQPAAAPISLAQQLQLAAQRPFHIELPHSHNPFSPYMASDAPPLDLHNSPRLENLVHDGKLYLSLSDVIALSIENNLDLAYFRYNFPIAQTDYRRTQAGGAVNGVNTSVVQSSTEGGFASSAGSAAASSASSAAGAGGIVTSTLGAGTTVSSFDPYLKFQGLVDHNTTQEGNLFQVGVPTFEQNTIEALANFSQSFPLGTSLRVNYEGQRFANNSPYEAINPTLYSNFQVTISQHLLAGFGIATNERYMHIARKNLQITNLAFRAQVIATVTQVENIYWDLISTYRTEQIAEGLLRFARQTLENDQKELQLNAIPALQVTRDELDVATSEGDLTVARANLRLNELLLKNAITKTDDPLLDEMPVIPLDSFRKNEIPQTQSIEALIAEAEKNRPDVAEDDLAMQVAEMSLKSIRSELLPTLDAYGFYAGAGIAGPQNPYCNLGPGECTSALPTGFGSMVQNTFNYSSPEYQVGINLSINLRNRVAKADQFRASLEFRQRQITFEEQKKKIRFDVRNSVYALQQAEARVSAARKARDLAESTFEITEQEQKLGAKSNYDTLLAQHDVAVAEEHLVAAQTAEEKARVDLDRATGETLVQSRVSIDDAQSGIVTHTP